MPTSKSLLELTVPVAVLYAPVQELLPVVEYLPAVIRRQIFRQLTNFRLREMELAWEIASKSEVQEPRDGFDPQKGDKFLFDRETQHEWKSRLVRRRYASSLTEKSEKTQGRIRNSRCVFWEDEFARLAIDRLYAENVDDLIKNHKLFVDVVQRFKLLSHDVCKDNVESILALRQLRRLKVLVSTYRNFFWETWSRLVQQNCHLTELKIYQSSFSDREVVHIRAMLAQPAPTVGERLDTCRITTLELSSVKFQPEAYLQFVALVGEMPQLMKLIIKRSIEYAKLLVNAVLRNPTLQRFYLMHNEVADDAFVGLSDIREPSALRHVCFIRDETVSIKSLEAICNASMDGVLNLESLEFESNAHIRDREIHALAPMLAPPAVGPMRLLTRLKVSDCNFGLQGVTFAASAGSQQDSQVFEHCVE